MYKDEEGKSLSYQERLNDQNEINSFLEKIFNHGGNTFDPYSNSSSSLLDKKMNFSKYDLINRSVSSEMFYSLMAILHENLPCANNFFRLRKNFRGKDQHY